MKVTLLVENNSLYCKFFHAEHGFSAFIEDADIKVLYDTGYSDAFIKNAEKMNIDLTHLDYVIISHGHYDHAGGLKYLMKYFRDKAVAKKPTLLFTSPEIFLKKYDFDWDQNLGMDVDPEILDRYFHVRYEKQPIFLTKNLVYLGDIEHTNDFEFKTPQASLRLRDGKWEEDLVWEDTQLAYIHKNGEEVSVISGCSHHGICNIMEYAKKVTGAKRVNTFLGGSHLQQPSEELLQGTIDYVKKEQVKDFYICHDTDLPSKMALAQVSNLLETGVSLHLEWE